MKKLLLLSINDTKRRSCTSCLDEYGADNWKIYSQKLVYNALSLINYNGHF